MRKLILKMKSCIPKIHNDHTYNTTDQKLDEQSVPQTNLRKNKLLLQNVTTFLKCFISEDIVESTINNKEKVEEDQIETVPDKVPDSVIDAKSEILQEAKEYVTSDSWLIISSILDIKKKNWTCAACPEICTKISMIYCDSCNTWYHWKCQGITKEPMKKRWNCLKCNVTTRTTKKRQLNS